MRFIALDFETASNNANSACQLAVVEVTDGAIVGQRSWLIRPPRMYFSRRNIGVHGIRPQDVRSAPTMAEVWVELQPIIDGQVLVAHNARFDMGVLLGSLAAYDIACPRIEFSCTRVLARAAWPGRQRYGLKPLGDWLGIRFKHHDALEDARACAHIALAAAESIRASHLEELETKLRVSRGIVHGGTICCPRRIGRSGRRPTAESVAAVDHRGMPTGRSRLAPAAWNTAAVVAAAGTSRPLAGKRLWLLGPLSGLTLEASRKLIDELGGECVQGLEERPDFIIASGTSVGLAAQQVGETAPPARRPAGSPSRDDSPPTTVKVLSERQFRALLPAGKSVRWNSQPE